MLRELMRSLIPPPAPYAPQAPIVPQRSGPWRLYLPRQLTSSGALEPGAVVETAPLSFGDAPTVMQEWYLEQLQIPCAVKSTTGAEAKETMIAQLMTMLLLGGDPIWTQPLELVLQPTNAGKTAFLANLTIADTFPQPIVVKRGQVLSLLSVVSFNLATASSALLLSGWEGGAVSHQGVIQYHALMLSGHRMLA